MKFKGLQEAGNYKVGVGTIAGGNGPFAINKYLDELKHPGEHVNFI
jgi:hypothetical protein